jgi:photosystem II stability/assembly factor-like uncharacterized protein
MSARNNYSKNTKAYFIKIIYKTMKKLLFVLYFFFSIIYSSFAQWEHQTSGTTNWLNSVYFAGSQTGWTVGDLGTVLMTTNGGKNWSPKIINTNDRLNGVRFINSKTGWITGNNGILFRTINGGINWNQQNIGTVKSLNAIYFINSYTGWIVGDSGTIFKTIDRGKNWGLQSSSISSVIYSVFFIDSNTGWISYDGGVSKTINGGKNWISKNILARTWRSIYFINPLTGWVSGSVYSLFKTTDGGESWSKPLPPNMTGDNGDSPPATYTSVYFLNENTGWFTSSHSFGGTINKTLDGGISWGTDFPTTKDEKLSSIFFYNTCLGWAVGENGTILHTFKSDLSDNPDYKNTTRKYSLLQNYPNPFNPVTIIRYQVAANSNVNLKVYDILGNEVETLVNEKQNPGIYEVTFDGSKLTNGIYFYRIQAGEFNQVKKMILLK